MFPKATPNAEAREILDSEPPQDEAMALCLRAWNELESARPIGMTVGPIWWPAALTWCERRGLGLHETDLVLSVLRRLDADRAEAINSRSTS